MPIFSFWPQTLINKTYSAFPINLNHVVDLVPTLPDWLLNILNDIGLGVLGEIDTIKNAFRIPPDTDDSSVNMGLWNYMRKVKNVHPDFV
jgi:hypothetical protein